jgi:hypothetical protein
MLQREGTKNFSQESGTERGASCDTQESLSSIPAGNGGAKMIHGPGDVSASESEIENALFVLDRAASIPGHVVQGLRQIFFNHISRTNGKSSNDFSSQGNLNRSADGQANAKRLRMNKQQAIEIYCQRPNAGVDDKLKRGSMSGCKDLAIKYGVTPKTIRDIWYAIRNRRSPSTPPPTRAARTPPFPPPLSSCPRASGRPRRS